MAAIICMLKLVMKNLKIINILTNIIKFVLHNVQNIGTFLVVFHITIVYLNVKAIKIRINKNSNLYKEINVSPNVIIMLNGYKKMMEKNVNHLLLVLQDINKLEVLMNV